jgi:hypothetical protein
VRGRGTWLLQRRKIILQWLLRAHHATGSRYLKVVAAQGFNRRICTQYVQHVLLDEAKHNAFPKPRTHFAQVISHTVPRTAELLLPECRKLRTLFRTRLSSMCQIINYLEYISQELNQPFSTSTDDIVPDSIFSQYQFGNCKTVMYSTLKSILMDTLFTTCTVAVILTYTGNRTVL